MNKQELPLPEAFAQLVSNAGYELAVTVTRADGAPVDEADLLNIRALLGGYIAHALGTDAGARYIALVLAAGPPKGSANDSLLAPPGPFYGGRAGCSLCVWGAVAHTIVCWWPEACPSCLLGTCR